MHEQKQQVKLNKQLEKQQKQEQRRMLELQRREGKQQLKKHNTPGPKSAAPTNWKEPRGHKTQLPGGGHAINAHGGARYEFTKEGRLAKYAQGGKEAAFRPNGSLRSFKVNGMQVEHGLHGERRIVTERPDMSLLVSTAPNRGYLQRTVVVNNRAYVQRTYVVNNVISAKVYRTYYYGGARFSVFVPTFYHDPRFYGWVNDPWPAPVYCQWGWYGQPWYGQNSSYFAPAPSYPTASLWLTDYSLAENLQTAFQALADANGAPPEKQEESSLTPAAAEENGATPQVTPEIKQAIAKEVEQQIVAEKYAASANPQKAAPSSSDVPPALDPIQRVFVVSSSLDAITSDGRECGLTPATLSQGSRTRRTQTRTLL
jgi:hypothetical protein